ncbi:unnamed protein product [Rangifer tarandus platyrhynchus]|uniref:Uncharacterized protein n=1 Tax=Rangifer tarandus platyrhynchus TaxID=3082113 RepID=A0ABN8Z299_RANTA|nr:unnamed protein product [Rangifer tarandus platyrhynchus]
MSNSSRPNLSLKSEQSASQQLKPEVSGTPGPGRLRPDCQVLIVTESRHGRKRSSCEQQHQLHKHHRDSCERNETFGASMGSTGHFAYSLEPPPSTEKQTSPVLPRPLAVSSAVSSQWMVRTSALAGEWDRELPREENSTSGHHLGRTCVVRSYGESTADRGRTSGTNDRLISVEELD